MSLSRRKNESCDKTGRQLRIAYKTPNAKCLEILSLSWSELPFIGEGQYLSQLFYDLGEITHAQTELLGGGEGDRANLSLVQKVEGLGLGFCLGGQFFKPSHFGSRHARRSTRTEVSLFEVLGIDAELEQIFREAGFRCCKSCGCKFTDRSDLESWLTSIEESGHIIFSLKASQDAIQSVSGDLTSLLELFNARRLVLDGFLVNVKDLDRSEARDASISLVLDSWVLNDSPSDRQEIFVKVWDALSDPKLAGYRGVLTLGFLKSKNTELQNLVSLNLGCPCSFCSDSSGEVCYRIGKLDLAGLKKKDIGYVNEWISSKSFAAEGEVPIQKLKRIFSLLVEFGFETHSLGACISSFSPGTRFKLSLLLFEYLDIEDSLVLIDGLLDLFEANELVQVSKLLNMLKEKNNLVVVGSKSHLVRDYCSLRIGFKNAKFCIVEDKEEGAKIDRRELVERFTDMTFATGLDESIKEDIYLSPNLSAIEFGGSLYSFLRIDLQLQEIWSKTPSLSLSNVLPVDLVLGAKYSCPECKGLGFASEALGSSLCRSCQGFGYREQALDFEFRGMRLGSFLTDPVVSHRDLFSDREEFVILLKSLERMGANELSWIQSVVHMKRDSLKHLAILKAFLEPKKRFSPRDKQRVWQIDNLYLNSEREIEKVGLDILGDISQLRNEVVYYSRVDAG